VRVLTGVASGARLELDLTREKAYWLGYYEPVVQRFLRDHITLGDVFYDVGAHHGFFSVCAGRLGAKVFAFEPAAANAQRLRRNAELNERLDIEVTEAAVWDRDGGVELVHGASDSEWRVVDGGTAPSITLDAFVRAHSAPSVLKIDVEGSEARVLRGAEALLRETPPIVVCELHGHAARDEVCELLKDFELLELESEWRLAALPDPAPIAAIG